MRVLVAVLTVVACVGATAAAAADSCARSEDFFLRHNVSADDGSETGASSKPKAHSFGKSRYAGITGEKRIILKIERPHCVTVQIFNVHDDSLDLGIDSEQKNMD
ncbi:hypothetical protein ACJJTC_011223 [Scirpophaga incertulas]